MKESCKYARVVSVKDDVYVFGGFNDSYNNVMSIDRYSSKSKVWRTVAIMCHGHSSFCACSFMNSCYIIGGVGIKSCFELNTKNRKERSCERNKMSCELRGI